MYRYPQGNPRYEFEGWRWIATIILVVGGAAYLFGTVVGLLALAALLVFLGVCLFLASRDDTI